MNKSALDPNWAYIEIAGDRAMLKRQMELLPRGLHHDNPEVPYGREIAPRAEAAGSFKLDLPLAEAGPYVSTTRRGAGRETRVATLEFHLGWSALPDTLPPGVRPVELEGEKLILHSYYKLASIQQIAASQPFRVDLPAVVVR